jgi:sporulation protein YlmC with PRC-barrel domain
MNVSKITVLAVAMVLAGSTVRAGQSDNMTSMHRASVLIGTDVRNNQNEKVGEVKDIVLDSQSDKASYLVLASGGIAGIGEKQIAVPLQAVRSDPDGKSLLVDLSTDDIKNAPDLGDDWPSAAGQEWQQAKDYFADKSQEFKQWMHKKTGIGDTPTPHVAQTSSDKSTADQQKWSRRVSNLLGIDVRNSQNQVIGELNDLVLDTDDGDVAFGLIEVAHVQGIENQTVACPWQSVSILSGQKEASINASDEVLRSAAFNRDSMPDFSNRDYGQGIYKKFDQQPYWTKYGYEGDRKSK